MAMAPATSSYITPAWRETEAHSTPEHGGLTIWLDESRTVPMFFRRIPPGEFRMGSREYGDTESPTHWAGIREPFYAGVFPVTQAQFAAFRPEHENGFPNQLRNPAERVSWDDAKAFLVWLNRTAIDLPANCKAALPCEAHWEYSCRAGTETDYPTRDGFASLREAGWFNENSDSSTHPVGELEPNAWGLYDLHGNVREWCEDILDNRAYRKREEDWIARTWLESDAGEDVESISDDRPDRVVLGGSWYDPA